MLSRYRTHLLLGLLAFACAQGWNRWNIGAMRHVSYANEHVSAGGTVMMVDDASYLQSVDDLLGARPDLHENALHHRPDLRPPGYGLWYLLPRLVVSQPGALAAVALMQCVLFALSVMLLWETLLAFELPTAIRMSLCMALAMLPMFQGFLFYTITEGVTPALGLCTLCSALLASKRASLRWLVIGAVLWSFLMLTRPALAWAGFAIIAAAWQQWRSLPRLALMVALAAAPLGAWWAHNVAKAGELIGLHPVYRANEPGINRPMHAAFWELAKSWGANGDAFHQAMEPAFRAAMECDTSSTFAEGFIALAPTGSLTADQTLVVRGTYQRWQRFNCNQLAPALRSATGTIPGTTQEEQEISSALEKVTHVWRGEHFFHHHVLVPLRVLKKMAAHSNLNLFLFQHSLRGRWWMEALRWLCALVHVALLLAVLVAALSRTPTVVRWCAAGGCFYLFYLAYVQRGVEERYTLPVLFIGLVCAGSVLHRFMRPNLATDNATP
ncbi:MAG: hypothetical protein IPL52_14665 [Flavobacteriales bacterium]|nr:hypothetical protein [Flavobacteriales bacterium]